MNRQQEERASWVNDDDNYSPDLDEDTLPSLPEAEELEVTSVKDLKGRHGVKSYRIYFGEHNIDVHEDIMIKYRMLKGSVFSKHELEEIIEAEDRQKAYAQALLMLSARSRSSFEIATKLKEKGWPETRVEQVLRRLENEGLVNDSQFAKDWVNSRLSTKGKGKMRLKQELRMKGISQPDIDVALGNIDEDMEMESARELAGKRWGRLSCERTRDQERKITAFLMRRGYSGTVAVRVVRELANGLYEEQEDGDM